MSRLQCGASVRKLRKGRSTVKRLFCRRKSGGKGFFGLACVGRKIRVGININIFFEIGCRRLGFSYIFCQLGRKIGFDNAVASGNKVIPAGFVIGSLSSSAVYH